MGRSGIFGLGLAALLPWQVLGHPGAASTARPDMSVNIIFDTDMWSDMDDALALAMLHTLQDRHELNLVAVTISSDEKWCAPYVDLINTFYGHPQIPVGVVRGGINTEAFTKKIPHHKHAEHNFTQVLSERRNKDGSRVYPHRLTDGAKAPEAVSLLRKILAAQPDGSVVAIQAGYSTNFARLLDSAPDAASPLDGRDLVKKKVRLLSIMAGNFARLQSPGSPEFNLVMDVSAAQKVFSSWPTPVVASGGEIGASMPYPAYSIEHDYSYVFDHPIAETYRLFSEQNFGWPHDHHTPDLTSVLYAARPDRNYFSVSKVGTISVLDDGSVQFEELKNGLHRYLIVSDEQRAKTLEAMVMLASQPPARGNKR